MRKFSKRLLTGLLAVAMVFSLSGMTAFAAEEEDASVEPEVAAEAVEAEDEAAPVEEVEEDSGIATLSAEDEIATIDDEEEGLTVNVTYAADATTESLMLTDAQIEEAISEAPYTTINRGDREYTEQFVLVEDLLSDYLGIEDVSYAEANTSDGWTLNNIESGFDFSEWYLYDGGGYWRLAIPDAGQMNWLKYMDEFEVVVGSYNDIPVYQNGEVITTITGDDFAVAQAKAGVQTLTYTSGTGQHEVTTRFVRISDLLGDYQPDEGCGVSAVAESDGFASTFKESDYYPDQAYFYCEEGTGIYRSAVDGTMGRMWCTDVTYFIVGHNYEDNVCTICGAAEPYPESDHNYSNNIDEMWTYTLSGATNGVYVTFDEQTSVEQGYDYISIYDDQGSQIGKFTGTELAGATVYVPTAGFGIELKSDAMVNDWGFAVTDVAAAEDAVDLGLYAVVDDPIDQVYVNDAPTPDVYLNGGYYALTEDEDFTVSADTSVAGEYAEVTITGIGNYTGTLTTHVYVWDYEYLEIPESEHPYANGTDEFWFYALEEADNGVYVTFDEQTSLEDGYDYIYIYDGDGNQLGGRYTGTELAGATVYVPTAAFTIELKSDAMENDWGFAVTAVEAVGSKIDLGLVATVDNPLSQVYVGQDPVADVQINGISLTEGEDYSISADTSEANVGTYVEVTITGIGSYSGELKTTVYVWDESTQLLPESDHPYEVNTEETWEYTVFGAENGIYVTFDERTETEDGYDFIYIYDSEDNLIGSYSGTELAGKTIYVPTETVKIHLSADYIYCYWGFAVTEIEAAGAKLDLGKAGSVKDPLDPIALGEDFDLGDVTFGGQTLVEGEDYAVSADTNTAGVMAEIDIDGIGDYEGTLVSHVFVYDDTAVTVTDFDIGSVEHDDADQELNQTIIVTITFSEDIELTHEDLRDDMLITIAGEDVYYTDRDITYDVQNGNQLVITMVSTDWVAIYGGTLTVSDVWRNALVPASGEGYVYMEDQSGRIPIGIVANNDMIAGTDAEPASTYVDVAHKANMRGMYSYQLVSTDESGNETVLGSWTSHAHNFYGDITREYIASVMASSVNDLDGYSVEYTDGDTFFTMTADNAVEGQTLAIRMDEIKAQINTAHAPQEVVEENNILNTQCSFCGYLYEREPANEGVGIVAQVTYADGSFESLELEEDVLDAILAEQPETTLYRGSTPYPGQYILITDLLEQTLGLENVEYLEVNSSDLWSSNSDEDFDLSNAYLYDSGYYRLAVNGAGSMAWTKYVIEFVVTIGEETNYPESDHPYTDNKTETWDYTLEGAENGVYVTFDERTSLETDYDYLYIYDEEGNLIGAYTGTELAGATVYVPTAGFTIELVADQMENDWGFAVTDVEAASVPIDLGSYGYVEDPIEQVFAGDTPTAEVYLNGGVYTLTQGVDYEISADTTVAGEYTEVTITGIGKYTGTLTTHAYVWDYDHQILPESDHDYASNTDESWFYAVENADNGIYVTFDERTYTESGWDYIYIYDGDGNLFGRYTGSTLAGVTLCIPTSSFTVRLTSDSVYNYWGFAVTSVEAIDGKIDLGIAATVDDPLEAVAVGETPTGFDVQVNFESLTEGVDYEVAADTGEANVGTYVEVSINGIGDYTGTLTTHVFVYDETHPERYVTVTKFDITSGEHDDADGELNQTIIATLTFSEDIELAYEDLSNDILITIAGDDISETDRTVTYEVQNGNQLVITMVSYDWVAIYNGQMTISNPTGEGILAVSPSAAVNMEEQSGRIPTGIVVNNDRIRATAEEPASTYVDVAHKANMRGMYSYELVSTDSTGAETILGSWTSHAHDFYGSVDEAYIANAIASDVATVEGYTVEYAEGDTFFIITADEAVAGERIAVRMDEINATINNEHAPAASYEENNIIYSSCSFCGEQYDKAVNEGVGLVVQVTYADGTFRSLVLDADVLDAILAEQEETTLMQGSTPLTGQYILVSDLLEQTFGLENITYMEFNSTDYWTRNSDSYDMNDMYLYDGGGYYRLALNGAGMMNWVKYIIEIVVTVDQDAPEPYPESDHNYPDSTDQSWTYTLDGAENGVYVTFDERTRTEAGWDYIYVYDGDDNLIGVYDGTTLAGVTLCIPTDTFTIRLTSDSNTNYWGFAVTDVMAIGNKIDLGIAGTVDDPLEAVAVDEMPTGFDVQVNFASLTEGVDYEVVADTSEANVGTYVEVSINGIGDYTGTLTTHVFVYDETHPERYVTVTNFDITSGEHDDADGEANQTIIATLTFSEDIELAYPDLSNDILITINGTDVAETARTVTYEVQNGNQLVITLVSYDWVAIQAGLMTISNPTGQGLLAVSPSAAVDMEEQSGQIPTGIVVNNDRIRATAEEPASTYVDVAHKANMRGMYFYELVSTDSTGAETILGSWSSHAHDFYGEVDEAYIAEAIASDVATVEGYTVEYTEGDTFFIITADEAVAGERLAVRMVEINATINTAHAPTVSYEENNVIYSSCSFCGEQYDKALNEGVGLAVQVTYADGTFRSMTIDEDVIDAILAEQPETTVNQGSTPLEGQYILATDLLEQTLGLENITYMEFNSSDYWTRNSSSYDMDDMYLYDGGGYYRLAINGAGMMNWVKYIIEIVVTVDEEPPAPVYDDIPIYKDGEVVATITGDEFAAAQAEAPEQKFTYTSGSGTNEVTAHFVRITDLFGDVAPDEGCGFIATASDSFTTTFTEEYLDTAYLYYDEENGYYRTAVDGSRGAYWAKDVVDFTLGHVYEDGVCIICGAEEGITYDDIPIYKDGEVVATITGDEFAAAQAEAPEQTFTYTSGSGTNMVTANFVLITDLLGDNMPDEGCGFTATAEKDGFTATFTEDYLDKAYIYYEESSGGYRTAVDGTMGRMWVTNMTYFTLGHIFEDGVCTICGAEEGITYDDIPIYKDGEVIATITGEEFAEAQAAAPEQTFTYTSGSGTNTVTANFVLITDLLGDNMPDEGCGFTATAEKDGFTATFTEDYLDKAYIYYEESSGGYRTAVDGTMGRMWVTNMTYFTLGHIFEDGVCTICGAEEPIIVDKTELNATIAAVETLDENDYTPESWAALQDVLAAAQAVAADDDATQEAVDDATAALETAIADLVPAADKDELNFAIEVAEALDESNYTEDSWAAMQEALAAAQEVAADPNATQEAVEEALDNLGTAIAALVTPGPTDKTELTVAIAAAGLLDESDYTPDSWAAMQEALAAAEAVAADPDATQDEVDDATAALEAALDALQPAADKDELNFAIELAEALDESNYTEDSWAAMQEALAAAQEVAADPNATQEAVDEATDNLGTAIAALVTPGPSDKTELTVSIAAAGLLDASDYTPDSWAAMQEALAAAEAVAADPDATQEEVDEATSALEDAMDNLVPVTPEKADLEQEIEEAEDLSEDDYTPESWIPFQEALEAAKAVLDDPDATPEEIEAAKEALKTAMDNLEPYKNGLIKDPDGVWRLYVNNEFAKDYTGYAENENGDWYVERGIVTFTVTNILKDQNGAIGTAGDWYYVIDSKVQDNFTGLSNFSNQYGWWYIKSGKVDFTRNSVDKNVNGWWYVTGGKVQFSYTGVANYKNDNGWWYIRNGAVDFNHNGIDKNKNGWWYVIGGKVQFDFTGLSNCRNEYGWWYIESGKVNFNHTGVEKNVNGWWYVKDSKVQFSFTGIASNQYGTWYISGGAVQFNFSGTVTINGRTYTVRGGRVS